MVLSDHLKSADWAQRNAEYISGTSPELLQQVRARLKPLLGL
jgi:hypothetical protein